MLKFQSVTADDLKVAATIERRRRIEEARKQRIFNVRERKIGIDKDFIDKQIEEKRNQREWEKQEEIRKDETLIRSSKLALQREHERIRERQKMQRELNDFRFHCQKPQHSDDFDLNDPDRLKKTKPLMADPRDDWSFGLSSAQKFEGEDLDKPHRMKQQREQMQSWMFQQVQERKRAETERQLAEKNYQEAVITRDKRAVALERMEQECRRRLNETTAKFNRALADEQEGRKCVRAMQEQEDNKAEIYNNVTGDFLTEVQEQAASIHGPDRPLAARYKGMTSEQIRVIREEQSLQVQEIQRMRKQEAQENEEWEKLMARNGKMAEIQQRKIDEERACLNKKIAQENRELAEEQKSRKEYLKRCAYEQKASPEFFAQFNRSTR